MFYIYTYLYIYLYLIIPIYKSLSFLFELKKFYIMSFSVHFQAFLIPERNQKHLERLQTTFNSQDGYLFGLSLVSKPFAAIPIYISYVYNINHTQGNFSPCSTSDCSPFISFPQNSFIDFLFLNHQYFQNDCSQTHGNSLNTLPFLYTKVELNRENSGQFSWKYKVNKMQVIHYCPTNYIHIF